MSQTVQTLGTPPTPSAEEAAILAAAKAEWRATPHPLLPWFADADLVTVLRRPDGAATVAQLFAEREERIQLSGDTEDAYALRYGFELTHWKDCDTMQRQFKFLYVAGGKRSGKSERAAKRLVQAALRYPRGLLWAFQGNLTTSIATQQKLIWKYMPMEVRALNRKQDKRGIWNINFTEKNGFADNIVVLPNRTKIFFLTYEMEQKDYEGWAIGSPWRPGMPLSPAEEAMQRLVEGTEGEIENLGFWADEDMPLPWLNTCELRCSTHNAKGMWTFSTTDGITPTIKQVLGTAVTIESRPAELLADRVNVTGVAKGLMPYRQAAERSGWGAIFFFSEFNPFGDNYANVKLFCAGKTSDVIMENAYGYARDTRNKAFPLFGEWNIVKRSELPRRMTRYMLTDPGDASRNWATIWVGVDERGRHYIFRDWPDEQTYGEWAMPDDDPNKPDGKRGPAQRNLGYGTEQLAEEWRRLEKAGLPVVTAEGLAVERSDLQSEQIMERYIDPRAAANEHIERHGGTNLYNQFMELDEPMLFTPWSGVEKSIGYTHVNSLLYWDRDKPMGPTNAPKLYVCEDCRQVRWMFTNFTGLGGDRAGGKDFADLVRGMALADLQFYESNVMESRGGGGGY